VAKYAWRGPHSESWAGAFGAEAEALADARETDDNEEVEIGECVWHKLSEVLSLEEALRDAPDGAAAGLWDEHDWDPAPSQDALKEAIEWIDDWADRHGLHPDFFTVKNVHKVSTASKGD